MIGILQIFRTTWYAICYVSFFLPTLHSEGQGDPAGVSRMEIASFGYRPNMLQGFGVPLRACVTLFPATWDSLMSLLHLALS